AATAERALAEPDVPGAVRENAAAALVLALSLHDTERARREATATLADPTRTADDPAVVTAATVLSNLMWDAGDVTTSLRLAHRRPAGRRGLRPAVPHRPAGRQHSTVVGAVRLGRTAARRGAGRSAPGRRPAHRYARRPAHLSGAVRRGIRRRRLVGAVGPRR